jgi:ribonucleotide monophosphatase NagD (HAD superfamily)
MNNFISCDIKKPEEILMVGDTPEIDIRVAGRFNMPSALITQTGIMADRNGLKRSLEGLAVEDFSDYFIKRLS